MTYDPRRQLGAEPELAESAAPFWPLIVITILLLAGLAIWSLP